MLISSSRPFASAAVHPLAVPWTAAPNPSIAESCPQGILSWQMAASALRSLVEAKALALAVEGDRSPCRTQPMAKLWLGHGQSSPAWPWYGVQRAELVYLSAPGSAKVRPGTILDKSGAGLTVAVGDGALRLSGFLSAEGKAWDTMALPVSPGQQLPSLTPAQRRAIAQVESQIAVYESTWQRRLAELQPVRLPYDSGQPAGVGAIFAQAPLALRSLLDHSPPAFLDILTEEGATLLLTAFVAFLGELNQWQGLHPWGQHCPVELQPLAGHRPWVGDRLGGDFPGRDAMANPATAPALGLTLGDLGLRTVHLEQTLHSDLLAALFTGHVPARFSLDLQQPLGANVGRIRMELDGLEIALTHRQDLSLALRPITSASAYPVLVELVADISDAPHTLGQALTVQFTEEGDACNWFYNPAILTEEEVELMQQRFLAILNAIAQAPQTPLGQVLGLTTEAGVVEV